VGKSKKQAKTLKLPKMECCESKTRCNRCPIQMLKDGDLPTGYGVHKRKLVKLDPITGKANKSGKVKIKKAELKAACAKKSGKIKAA